MSWVGIDGVVFEVAPPMDIAACISMIKPHPDLLDALQKLNDLVATGQWARDGRPLDEAGCLVFSLAASAIERDRAGRKLQ